MTLIAIAVILFSTILLILCLPVTYEIKVHIGPPFHLAFSAGWGRQLIRKSWSYTVGEELKDELYILGKKDSPPPEKESTPIEESQEKPLQDAAEEIKKAADEDLPSKEDIEKEVEKAVEQEVEKESDSEGDTKADPEKKKGSPGEWISLIVNTDFLAALFTWLSRLIGHGQIRHLSLCGILGLPEPHKTGILAGSLYAFCPGNLENLQFNFLEEQYDCTAHASGRLYPAMLLLFTLMFALSRPVRHILIHWFAVNKETRYG